MRQLFTWRFLAAIGALVALALVARALLVRNDDLQTVIEPEPIERRIDLIDPIESAAGSPEFTVGRDGVTTGFLDLTLPGGRVVRVAPGTLGEVDCPVLAEASRCAIFADVLGEAIVWFAIVPQGPRSTAELPPIVDLEDGRAIFENGWLIPFPPVIERECPGEDIPTFSDFLRRFGPDSVSIVDLRSRQVVAVRCAGADEA